MTEVANNNTLEPEISPTSDEQNLKKNIIKQIEKELTLPPSKIDVTVALLQEGNTVPFIARYRKEATGGLDEEQIHAIDERWQYIRQLWQRKEEVLTKIKELGQLTDELKQTILEAEKLQQVEDYYRPFKPKRRTRATLAKAKGLEPLAEWLLQFTDASPEQEAAQYVMQEPEGDHPEEHIVHSVEEALQGAMDIIAERVADEPVNRQWVRQVTYTQGRIECVVKNKELDEQKVYANYYEYSEAVQKIVPHRILAINRAEKEDILKVSISAPEENIKHYLFKWWVTTPTSPAATYVEQACVDGYARLLAPAVERDIRRELTDHAEEQAIQVFSKNLRSLLLQAPVRGKTVLGVDPAFRTGCKLSVVNDTGKVLAIEVIYPTPPLSKVAEAKQIVEGLIDQHAVDIIAIGNGTASRETEQFIADLIQERKDDLSYIIINEAGASVYSASKLAREEFPNLDVSERSAISIARRLQDPLAELVKIDPKSIGIGQYQHDVAQNQLSDSLSFVVETVVNQVGVDVNTASVSLLQYVSGLNQSVAKQIVQFRDEHGRFAARHQLKKVPRLGAKTFEQSIGFLRIFEGEDPLDQTPIHPETYVEAKTWIEGLGFAKEHIGSAELSEALRNADLRHWSTELGIGLLTLEDMREALLKPGRDPREELTKPLLQKDILQLEDLNVGLKLEGTVRNVVDFGAFVDIGLKNDGLVHISELSDRFVKHPMDVVSVGDIVTVWVKKVDEERQRVGLTMVAPQ